MVTRTAGRVHSRCSMLCVAVLDSYYLLDLVIGSWRLPVSFLEARGCSFFAQGCCRSIKMVTKNKSITSNQVGECYLGYLTDLVLAE